MNFSNKRKGSTEPILLLLHLNSWVWNISGYHRTSASYVSHTNIFKVSVSSTSTSLQYGRRDSPTHYIVLPSFDPPTTTPDHTVDGRFPGLYSPLEWRCRYGTGLSLFRINRVPRRSFWLTLLSRFTGLHRLLSKTECLRGVERAVTTNAALGIHWLCSTSVQTRLFEDPPHLSLH